MKRLSELIMILWAALAPGCAHPDMRGELESLAARVDGSVGIAYIGPDGADTLTVNNGVRFPLMSVMKLHQGLAASAAGCLDSIISVEAAEIDSDTWSPMLNTLSPEGFEISVDELMDYAVTCSDNNASNILFGRVASPAAVDSFIRTVSPDGAFSIKYSEAEMKADHALSRGNWSSPMAAARLIKALYDSPGNEALKASLERVTTGSDRLGAAVDHTFTLFAHKTGSGYRDDAGRLMAFNDVGYFRCSDGRAYALAVFITDFGGSETEAAEVIAEISRIVAREAQR